MVGYPIGPMTSLQERIAIILRDHPDLMEPGGVGRLAKIAGVSSSAVSQWISGNTKSIRADAAAKLHAYYGYRLDWLIKGKGPRHVAPQAQSHSNEDVSQISVIENARGTIPVVGVMYMSSSGNIERFTEEEGRAGGVKVHSVDPDACAIHLMGESVGIFRAGWYVVIEPNAAVITGEPVLLTCKDGRRFLGELLSQAGGATISLLGLTGIRRAFLSNEVRSIFPVAAVVSPSKYSP